MKAEILYVYVPLYETELRLYYAESMYMVSLVCIRSRHSRNQQPDPISLGRRHDITEHQLSKRLVNTAKKKH